MVKVLLFGPARAAFGAETCEVEADDVDGVLSALGDRGDTALQAVLRRAQVWVNGEPAPSGTAVTAGDEVAVVPPVSGGVA